MDKLTTKFQLALADAPSLVLGRDHQFIEPVHLMMALLGQEGGTARPLLAQAGVNIGQVRPQLMEALDRLPRVEGTAGEVHVAPEAAVGRLEAFLNAYGHYSIVDTVSVERDRFHSTAQGRYHVTGELARLGEFT